MVRYSGGGGGRSRSPAARRGGLEEVAARAASPAAAECGFDSGSRRGLLGELEPEVELRSLLLGIAPALRGTAPWSETATGHTAIFG